MDENQPDVEQMKVEADNKQISNKEPQKKNFVVEKWEARALWSWDITLDLCPICRNHIADLCIECQAQLRSPDTYEECAIACGACNHNFHSHCISRWLKTHHVCPLDNMEWVLRKCGR